jgi:hypothetical protein
LEVVDSEAGGEDLEVAGLEVVDSEAVDLVMAGKVSEVVVAVEGSEGAPI